MIEHDYAAADITGRKWCRHCGALWHAEMTSTCLERPDPSGAKPRAIPPSVLEDGDAITAGLARLKAERDAALARPDEYVGTEGCLGFD